MPQTGVADGVAEAPEQGRREGGSPYDPALLVHAMASQRAAVISAPSPYMIFDTAGRTVLLNDKFTRETGYNIHDLPDIRACLVKMRRVPESEVDTIHSRWVREIGPATSKEVTVFTSWDEMRVWEIRTTVPVLWPDGSTVVLQSVFDLTEQRRLEQALRCSQEEMRTRLAELEALYFTAPLGLGMLDRNLNFVRVNKALARMNGVPASEHIGRFAFDIVPDLKAQAESVLRQVIDSGEPINDVELSVETAKTPGERRDWLEQFYPIRDDGGDVVGLGIIAEEITERKRVERQLESTNLALRQTLDLLFLALRTARVAVFAQDHALRYVWVGGDYFGCDPAHAVGRDDAALLPPELVEPMRALKTSVLATGEPRSGDFPYLRDGKTLWCNVHLEPWQMRDGVVQSLLGAVSDVSERKATEQHIRTLLSELAHRSKNLLTVIQVMARRSVSPGVPSTAFVDSFIERLSGLAQSHDLLAREDWRGISMLELVTSQIGHLRTSVAERLVVEGPNLVLTPVAAQNLGMAIHELSTNAVKYGALSVLSGQVQINWSVFSDEENRSRLRLSWVERGGPPVAEPTRRGFGRFVIEAIAARALSGTVELRFDPDGVSCVIEGAADDSVLSRV